MNRKIKKNITDNNNLKIVKNDMFGVGVSSEFRENILVYILKIIEKKRKKIYIVTPNPEIIILSEKNACFKKILNEADVALCDGMGIFLAGKILGKPYKERITGISFIESVCEKIAEKPITIGFLGGKKKVAENVSKCLMRKYPGLHVAFAASEWSEDDNSKSIDILFVAFGNPKQEFWMYEYIKKTQVRIMVGVGGSFDQIVDSTLRPPEFIDKLGFGWLYRLIRQPWRWKRQLALMEFIFLLIRSLFNKV
jgi:N-acetylglucosaminyldiphosphoundecaprenol N-acetyl-beta-D-mannosaminyltransferase